MVARRNVYLAQTNYAYGRNAFLPYSVGIAWATANSRPEIRDEYSLKEFIFLRERVEDVVGRMEKPDVFGASCYIWNSRHTLSLARAVKETFPECLVVLGGPHVPDRSEGFFKEHPWVDVLVHHEGEITFTNVLLARMAGRELDTVSGISFNDGINNTVKTPPASRIMDLDKLPSPYLEGYFDGLMKGGEYDFHLTSETHRGCPYSCTFL